MGIEELPDTYQKIGPAALVEDSVQAVVDKQQTYQEAFAELSDALHAEIKGDKPTAVFKRATRRQQAAYALAGYGIGEIALPRMLDWLSDNESLSVSNEWDTGVHQHWDIRRADIHEETEPLYTQTVSARYWLANSAIKFFDAVSQESHPFFGLGDYINNTWKEYVQAYKPWKAGPGKNRWPTLPASQQEINGQQLLAQSLLVNTKLGIDEMAAIAVHYVLSKGTEHNPSLEELQAIAIQKAQRIRWLASVERNMGRRAAQAMGLDESSSSHDATFMFVDRLTDPPFLLARFIRPFLEFRAVNDEEFCPVEAIRYGPMPNAGTCAGDVRLRFPDDESRQINRKFYAAVGLEKFGTTFSMTSVAIGIGKKQADVHLYPPFVKKLANRGLGPISFSSNSDP